MLAKTSIILLAAWAACGAAEMVLDRNWYRRSFPSMKPTLQWRDPFLWILGPIALVTGYFIRKDADSTDFY